MVNKQVQNLQEETDRLRASSEKQAKDDQQRIDELNDELLKLKQQMEKQATEHQKVVEGKDQEIDNTEKKMYLIQEHAQEVQNELDALRTASEQQQKDDAARIKELEEQLVVANSANLGGTLNNHFVFIYL